MKLVDIIADGKEYNEEVIWMTAHMHDWGAYGEWKKEDTDHVERSLEVVEPYLKEREYPDELIEQILDCIANHHSDRDDLSLEAALFRDADAVDFLGVIGTVRNFSRNPKELRRGFRAALEKREKLPEIIKFPKARQMAEKTNCRDG